MIWVVVLIAIGSAIIISISMKRFTARFATGVAATALLTTIMMSSHIGGTADGMFYKSIAEISVSAIFVNLILYSLLTMIVIKRKP